MDKEILDSYIKAGQIAAECLQYGKSLMKKEALLRDVCDKVEEKIMTMGGGIAFPAQISLNQVAAHFCPTQDDNIAFKEGDLAKLDIGVHINGYIADTALTVNFGDHDKLAKASRDAVDNATKLMAVGVELREIGKTIQETISSYGFSPIRNLSGHGLDRFEVHTSPTIPNFDTGDTTTLHEDMVCACEPFATTGKGSIFESSHPTVYGFIAKRPVRSPYGRELLTTIEKYEGLPFTTRWLQKKHGAGKTAFGLKELTNAGVIREYPPLPEVTNGLVSQAEHSVLFDGKKKIIFTKKE
ncbi:MAG: type II methionyl aminopeptidase [Nanoarchaeota archaeon]